MKKFITALTMSMALCMLSAAALISNMRIVEPAALTSAHMTSPELTKFTVTSQPMTSQGTEPAVEIPESSTAVPTEPITEPPTDPPTDPPTELVTEAPASDDFYLSENAEYCGAAHLSVDAILQEPELPTGCEVTALATVLRYYGYGIDKKALFDNYMPSAGVGESTFDCAFIGDPTKYNGWGCFAPVVAQTAACYLWDMGSNLTVYDMTGSTLWELFPYIDSGCPVIVWASMELKNITWEYRWTIGGSEAWFPTGEHCMVLTGYDISAGTVTVADPRRGVVEYSMSRFEEIYDGMYRQAVVIM